MSFTPSLPRPPVQILYRADSVRELAGPDGTWEWQRQQRDELAASNKRNVPMPLVDIQLIEGVFEKNQKQEMIRKVTDAMVEIEGEAMRGVTWVRIHEIASGEWGIGGKGITAADVKAMQRNGG
jgi:4-oxalocrotonate tautomerase